MCATLGPDDVRIAENLLDAPDSWFDDAPASEAELWLSAWLGGSRAFGFMGGRTALYAIARAISLGRGTEVIVPGLTCQVVVNAFEYNGATCIFADIEKETFNMDSRCLVEKITSKTRAILLQHTFGVPAKDTRKILDIARRNDLIVIEDVAHGLGGTLDGRKLGTFGDVAFFSTERTKIINTIHGGFAATSDPAIQRRLEEIHNEAPNPPAQTVKGLLNTLLFCYYTKVHADREKLYKWARNTYGAALIPQMTDNEFSGNFEPMYRYKMPGAVGILALNQLEKFESFMPLRREAASHWNRWAAAKGFQTSQPGPNAQCAWVRFPVIVSEAMKQDTRWIEEELSMEPGVWFQTPCHPNERTIPDIPNGWQIARSVINLPTGLWVT